jgi:hemerythrin-like domain-containing protein
MPVQIGQKPGPDFTQPIRLLSDCHRRIERFLGVLVKVAAEVPGGELSPEYRLAFTAALQYFRDAAPKHTADEELSLFPRLRAAGGEEVERVLAEVDRLEADHTRAGRLHDEVDQLGTAWLQHGRLPPESAERLRSLTAELRSIYAAHIAAEDTVVFPLSERVLGAGSQLEIGREMAARRGVVPAGSTLKVPGSIPDVHSSH